MTIRTFAHRLGVCCDRSAWMLSYLRPFPTFFLRSDPPDVRRLVMIPANARPAHRRLRQKLDEIQEWNETSELNRIIPGATGLGAGRRWVRLGSSDRAAAAALGRTVSRLFLWTGQLEGRASNSRNLVTGFARRGMYRG